MIGPTASDEALKVLVQLLGRAAPSMKEFVGLHDGLVLYCDTRSDTAGVRLFEVANWQPKTQEMRESMLAMGWDVDDLPVWYERGIVIGEIPHSANYFVLQTDGGDAGQVFYCDHDDFEPDALAESFAELLHMIVEDPANFLYERGCYARYSDGNTDTQWIPREYLRDCGELSQGLTPPGY
ncbi:MAG: SMI1/KNR4 family protein [Pirellulales bacterium]